LLEFWKESYTPVRVPNPDWGKRFENSHQKRQIIFSKAIFYDQNVLYLSEDKD